MLKPEQIRYVMEWAESGNEPRHFVGGRVPLSLLWMEHLNLLDFHTLEAATFRLNSVALTIASMGAALVQANEVAEGCHEICGEHLDDSLPDNLVKMRRNLKELIK